MDRIAVTIPIDGTSVCFGTPKSAIDRADPKKYQTPKTVPDTPYLLWKYGMASHAGVRNTIARSVCTTHGLTME
jgi:hypothetical protein